MKQIFVDVETAGLNPEKSGLIQLAGAIAIDKVVIETFNYCMKPPKGKECDKEALEITGTTREQIEGYDNSELTYLEFRRVLLKYIDPYDKTDKFQFLAYNSPFDSQFVRQWFKDHGDNYYGGMFWHPDICVMRMAADYARSYRQQFRNFKLETVCKYFKIEPKGDLHDAMVDIDLTIKLYNKIKGEGIK